MKVFGVEANHIIEELPEFIEFIKNETRLSELQKNIFLFEKKEDAQFAQSALMDAALFEDFSLLYYIINGEKGETFDDFGIESKSGFYLFSELLCAFVISGGVKENIQMAKYQFQEHLVFTGKEDNVKPMYFAELHLKELIIGIANAYDIQVSFLDLDK
ncbi:hypothetical protein [Cytobacillus sp. NCCP-133]|uniref:hypothetical protein n=1 Tax=Cytobacillus sp. NCCP-133 TaxID=766848 RepID=UPI00222F1FDF|nr:hypothetical protein [Cytobacillus sp. NCCP-133]GLB58186.1 hypothetical protein NCCP133_03190 [Cytobacillus sp. NCCP-133]